MTFSPLALKTFQERLQAEGETPFKVLSRVSRAIFPDDKEKRNKFYRRMKEQRMFINSPGLRNLGDPLMPGLPHACFVLPVNDSIAGPGSIFETMGLAASVHQAGGGTGFCFSTLRPKNAKVRSTNGIASGPVSFMGVYNSATEVIKQGSQRRGANMGTKYVFHPDIMEFVNMKDKRLPNGDLDDTVMQNFNVSVMLDSYFFLALHNDMYLNLNFREGGPVPSITYEPLPVGKQLVQYTDYHGGDNLVWTQVYGSVKALDIFEAICEKSWKNGEPGVLFVDKANQANPVPHLYDLNSTNPCGEQWLGPYESCVLGSINLANYVYRNKEGKLTVNWPLLREDIPLYVEALDNMIDVARYPDPRIEAATKRTRRIGLGVMGWADLLYLLEIPYDSEEALLLAESLGTAIRIAAHRASEALGEEKGTYPALRPYTDTPRRNAAVTCIAPTGTLSILAGCSGGIEPVVGLNFLRQHRLELDPNEVTQSVDGSEIARQWFLDHPEEKEAPRWMVTTHDISPEWHVRMQAVWQEFFSDNAISKTINFTNEVSPQEIGEAILLAYELDCRGLTMYRDGSRNKQVFTVLKDCNGPVCEI